jgi:hypothetical protein
MQLKLGVSEKKLGYDLKECSILLKRLPHWSIEGVGLVGRRLAAIRRDTYIKPISGRDSMQASVAESPVALPPEAEECHVRLSHLHHFIAPTSSVVPITFGAPKISDVPTITRPSKKCKRPWMAVMSSFGKGRFIVRLCHRSSQDLTRLGTRAKSVERSWEEKPLSNK